MLTIRELINILIDAPDKDKKVEVEYMVSEAIKDNHGYEWNQMDASRAVIHGGGCTIEAHPRLEWREEAEGG